MDDTYSSARTVSAEAVIARLQHEIGELHKRIAVLEVQLGQTQDRDDP